MEQLNCDTVRWIDVTDPSASEMERLSHEYGLNENIVRDCMQPEHLPKYEFVDGVHFLILRFFNRTPGRRVDTIKDLTNKIAIFYTDGFLITIHKSEASFLDTLHRKHAATGTCSSA